MLTNFVRAEPPVLPSDFEWVPAAIDTDEVVAWHAAGSLTCRVVQHAFSEPRAAERWSRTHECDVCAHPHLNAEGECPDCGWDTSGQEDRDYGAPVGGWNHA